MKVFTFIKPNSGGGGDLPLLAVLLGISAGTVSGAAGDAAEFST